MSMSFGLKGMRIQEIIVRGKPCKVVSITIKISIMHFTSTYHIFPKRWILRGGKKS